MPYGSDDITRWLEMRNAGRHNSRLRQLMNNCGCGTTDGFIHITHAASLNDTFWIKPADEEIGWSDVSLYRNQFSDAISKSAFESRGSCHSRISGFFPEFSTGGSFPKCWKRETDGIFLYKGCNNTALNAGTESYSEVLASELASRICKNSVHYDIAALHGRSASRCRLFTNEEYGYLPYSMIPGVPTTPDGMLEFYGSIGAEDDFRRMCVLDALIVNTDRHQNNHGVLFRNDTLDITGPAPVFDLNLSLMPGETMDSLRAFECGMARFQPCIGDDFIAVAKALLTSDMRTDLINLKGYKFEHRGDHTFPEERVKILESMINHHINCILD